MTNARNKNGLTFHPLPNIYDEYSNVAKGYRQQALIRPGDPIVTRAPAFDPENQSAKNKPYSLAPARCTEQPPEPIDQGYG